MEEETIHSSVQVHPSVIIEGNVKIGRGTKIGPYSYLKGPLIIGTDNQIGANVQIGVDPEHKKKASSGIVHIGNKNNIREFSVIQRGTGDFDTTIENNCFIMAYCYIAHDCLIESDVLLCAKASLGGHCCILKGAGVGLGAFLREFTVIGSHAFIGMGSVVVKDIPPFFVVKGNPAHFFKINEFPLEELKLKQEDFCFEQGRLRSKHSCIIRCVENFEKHSKGRPLIFQN